MTITKTINGTTLEAAVEGRLDTTTAPAFEKEIADSLEGITGLVLNFEKLEYISSSGLRALLRLQRSLASNAEIQVIIANDMVKEVFEVTGFDSFISIQ